MRSRIFAVVLILVIAGSVAQAKVEIDPAQKLIRQTESNGTWGSFSVSGGQTGPLEVTVDVSATTAGDGSNTVLNMVFLRGQVYNGLWTTQTWTSIDTDTFPNSSPNLSFSSSWTFTVPAPGNYAIWGDGFAGIYYGTTTGGLYSCPASTCYTQTPDSCCYPVTTGDLFYVNNIQPPTPTPPPGGYGGNPIPTLNWLGILAMVAVLAGVAMLIVTRR